MKQVILIVMCFSTFNVSAHNDQDMLINNLQKQISDNSSQSFKYLNKLLDRIEALERKNKALEARVKQLEKKKLC